MCFQTLRFGCRWALLVLAACTALGWPVRAVTEDASTYTLAVPKEVPLAKVQLFHVVKRPVGPYFWPDYSKIKSEKEHAIIFPLKPGDAFEAVLYYPGYQFATVFDPAVAAGEHRVEIAFQPLATVVLKGKCPMFPDKDIAPLKYVVQISYTGDGGITHLEMRWRHSLTFPIVEVPLSADGTFTATIPDFFRDPLSSKDNSRHLDFLVHSTSAGHVIWTKKEVANRRALGLPDSSMVQDIGYVSYGLAPRGGDEFKIAPVYRKRVEFVEHSGPPIDGLLNPPEAK